jgi:hypothetical protein
LGRWFEQLCRIDVQFLKLVCRRYPTCGFDGSNLGHAAIDEEFDSIDEAALAGSEEQDSLRNFIGDADASKRDYGSLGSYETRHLLFGETKLVVTLAIVVNSRSVPPLPLHATLCVRPPYVFQQAGPCYGAVSLRVCAVIQMDPKFGLHPPIGLRQKNASA